MSKLLIKVLVIIFACTSCHTPMLTQSQDVIIVDAIRKENNFNFALRGLVRVGVGVAYDADNGTLKETYQTRKARLENIDAARNYFIGFYDDYIKPFNDNKLVGSLVKGYPFSPKNTEIQITFLDEQGTPVASPFIARIKNDHNRIIMYSYDSNSGRYQEINNESFI